MYTINGVYRLDADTFQIFESSVYVKGDIDVVLCVKDQALDGKTLIFAQQVEGVQPRITVYLNSS